VPREARLRNQVAALKVSGAQAVVREVADHDGRRRPLGDDDRADRARHPPAPAQSPAARRPERGSRARCSRRHRSTAGVAARSRRALWIWLAFVAVAALITAESRYVADLSAFLPSAPTAEQAVLLDQVRSGVAARLLLIGIEGGDAATRSRGVAATREGDARSGRFEAVHNGDNSEFEASGRFLFEHRYLLSPAVEPARFTVDGLRAAIDDTVALLGTPAGALIKPICCAIPTGETVRMAEAMLPRKRRAAKAASGSRATRRARSSSRPHVLRAPISTARSSLRCGPLRVRAAGRAGPAASRCRRRRVRVTSRAQIKAEVERLAIAGSAIIVALLLVAFGSLRSLAIAVLPVATGVLAGIAAVSIGFGQVHGITLGFGTTLIGEAVDYAIYYLIQARQGATPISRRPGTTSRHERRRHARLRCTPMAGVQLADRAARPADLAVRFRCAGLLGLSGAGPARRVLDRRPRCRRVRHALRVPDPVARRRTGMMACAASSVARPNSRSRGLPLLRWPLRVVALAAIVAIAAAADRMALATSARSARSAPRR
jgi:hypothetical protein